MEMPINYKDIEINGRKFRLNKLNARTGSYMLFKLLKILTPIFKNVKQENLKDMDLQDLNLTELAESLFDFPEEEFRYIQDNLLQVTEERLDAGNQKVLNSNLGWGILNIENDVSLVMNLTIQCLVFNVSGFFGGNLLELIKKAQNTYK